jgi:hypothetical protein
MKTREPSVRAATSDPLDFFRGVIVAFPISVALWIAIARMAGWR